MRQHVDFFCYLVLIASISKRHQTQYILTISISSSRAGGERTGLVVRASDSESGDPGSILGRVGVLFP